MAPDCVRSGLSKLACALPVIEVRVSTDPSRLGLHSSWDYQGHMEQQGFSIYNYEVLARKEQHKTASAGWHLR
jgi:hypothetical protein